MRLRMEEENSEGSSEGKNSNKSSREGHRRSHQHSSREVEVLIMEKKQLENAVSNSLRKIDAMLQNELSLKKTIH